MAESPEEAARVQDLGYRYGPRWALTGVDLAVRAGESLAVLGPNGAGKSTLIACMLGLLAPHRGTVSIYGTTPRAAARAGRVAGMLQGATLPQFASVLDVLRFAARLYPAPLSVERAAALTGVADLLRRPVDRLSGGQRRRVQFAMAVVSNAPFLFLDEPTEGMDIEGRADLWRIVREHAAAARERTVVFTTHDLSEADRHADRIVLLAGGRVVAVDTPGALKARLARRRVRFAAPPGVTAQLLSRRTGLAVVPCASGFEVATDDSDGALRALISLDLGLYDFRTAEGSLDEVFHALVAKERGDGVAVSGE